MPYKKDDPFQIRDEDGIGNAVAVIEKIMKDP